MAEAIGALRVEVSASIANFEDNMKKAGTALAKWNEGQQRSAMSMSRAHDEAKKFNVALNEQRAAQEKAAAAFNSSAISVGALGQAFGLVTNPLVILGGLVTGFAAGLANATTKLLENASALSDMSAKTDISTSSLQVLQHQGALVGVTLTDITGAVVQMNRRLVDSPKEFSKLGLSVAALKAMRPEEALAAIAEKVQSIKSPAEQTAAAMNLLGRSGATLLPLLKSDLGAAADEAERLGLVLSEETIAAADALGDRLTTLGAAWEALQTQTAAALASSETVADALDLVTLAIGSLAKKSEEGREERTALIDDLLQMTQLGKVIAIASALASTSGLPTVKNKPAGPVIPEINFDAILGAGLKESSKFLKEVTKDQKEAAAAAKKHAEEVRKLGDAFSGMAATKELAKMAEAYRANKAAIEANTPGFAAFREKVALLAQTATTVPPELRAIVEEMEALSVAGNAADFGPTLEELGITLVGTGGLWTQYGDVVEQELVDAAVAAAEAEDAFAAAMEIEKWKAMSEAAGQVADILGSLTGVLEDFGVRADSALGQLVEGFAGAAEGASALFAGLASGNPAQIAQGIAGIGRAMKGLSESTNAWVRAAGVIINAPLGLAGLIFGGGGPTAAEKLAHDLMLMRTEFINSAGGLVVLEAKAKAAGISLDAMWNARTVEEYEAAVRRVQTAIELTEEATDLLSAANDRWNISASDMGPAAAQRHLHLALVEIFRDFRLMEAAGYDMAAVLRGEMGDAINELVQESIAAGVALPETMRPMIERMIELGLLVDENGTKITNVSQLTFTETLEEGVGRLIEKIELLVNALLGIPPEVDVLVKVNVRQDGEIPGEENLEAGGGGGTGEEPPEFATGGIGDFGAGTLAMLHGREAIIPLDGGGPFATGFSEQVAAEVAAALSGKGGENIIGHVYLDGQEMRDAYIKWQRVGALTRT